MSCGELDHTGLIALLDFCFPAQYAIAPCFRLKFRGSFATPDRSSYGNVWQLALLGDASEQQPASAHIPSAHKVGREFETLFQMSEENSGVLLRSDTSKQDSLAMPSDCLSQDLGITFERSSIANISGINRDLGEGAKVFQRDPRVGGKDAAVWCNHQNAGNCLRRLRKCLRVDELSAEIEAAQKAEDFTKRDPFLASQPCCQGKLGALIVNQFSPLSAGVGWRQNENPLHLAK